METLYSAHVARLLGHSEKRALENGSFLQLSQQQRTSLRNDIVLTSWSNNKFKAREPDRIPIRLDQFRSYISYRISTIHCVDYTVSDTIQLSVTKSRREIESESHRRPILPVPSPHTCYRNTSTLPSLLKPPNIVFCLLDTNVGDVND